MDDNETRRAACAVWDRRDEGQATRIWLDCDTGHDDAFAILLAAHCPRLDLLGVSTVHGNSSLVNTTRNTLSILEAIGKSDIDVYPGAAKPFCREAAHAPDIHGESGLDGTTILPAPSREAITSDNNATVHAMYEALTASAPNTAWLVSTGSLTNIALLFASFPRLVDHIAGLSIMGGAIGGFFTHASVGRTPDRIALAHTLSRDFPEGIPLEADIPNAELATKFRSLNLLLDADGLDDDEIGQRLQEIRQSFGNTTDFAEFNIYCDPEAAASIFSNQQLAAKTTLIPLDITHQVLGNAEVLKLLSGNHDGSDNRLGKSALRHLFLEIMTFFAHTYEREFGMCEGPPLHDPIAVVPAFAPEILIDNGGERYQVFVVREGDEQAFDSQRRTKQIGQCGRTIARMVPKGQAGVRIPRSLRVPEFWEMINLALEKAEEISRMEF